MTKAPDSRTLHSPVDIFFPAPKHVFPLLFALTIFKLL